MTQDNQKTTCPYCNYKATEHETLDMQTKPEDGDISFCISCGEVSNFKNSILEKVDLNLLDESTKKEINGIRVAWLKTKAIQTAK